MFLKRASAGLKSHCEVLLSGAGPLVAIVIPLLQCSAPTSARRYNDL